MKILILCKNFVDIIGGVEYVTRNLAEQYSKSHQVYVLAHLNSTTSVHPDVDSGAEIYYISTPRIFEHNRYGKLGSIISSLIYSIKSLIYINKLNPDVIHVQHTEQSIEACLSKIMKKIPYCISLHGEWRDGMMFPKYLSKFWKYYPNIRLADSIVALTKERLDEAVTYWNRGDVLIIPNGVDSSLFSPRIEDAVWPPKIFEMITVSRLTDVKRISDVILAMADIKKIVPNIHLTVVGTGPEYDNLIKLAESLDLMDKINFTGFITQEEKIKYMHHAHVFLLPSLYEGFPLTILEAFSTGLPVVATPVSGTSELIITDKTGYIVPFCQPEKIAEIIINLHNKENDTYVYMSKYCRTLAERYDWETVAKAYENIYQKMIS